jgi:hypothetical protein
MMRIPTKINTNVIPTTVEKDEIEEPVVLNSDLDMANYSMLNKFECTSD